ncbi:hypothetical protein [Salinicola aestuarinus]|uniref:hypothetical protein n=1 Tax=Salinicola aestuarinus TaxID=1949082 RepID=UPI000DA10D5B|nr:hypothetical protein [Salinicola aestuarinus]
MKTTTFIAVTLALSAGSAVAQESSELTGYEETVGGIYVDKAYCNASDRWEKIEDLPPKIRDRIVDVCIDIQTGGPENRF